MVYGVQRETHILPASEGEDPQDSGASEGLVSRPIIGGIHLKGRDPSGCFES